MFSIFYWILSLLLLVVFFPLLLFKLKKQRYKLTIPKRFFLYKNNRLPKNKVWFHANSLGEVKGLLGITKEFNKDDIAITMITNTGFEEALKQTNHYRLLPYELFLPFWITKQKILIVTEAELWYMLFFIAKLRGIKIFVINSRINEKRYQSYKKFSWFYKKIFSLTNKVYAQRDIDKQRLKEFGAKDIEITGNIKLVNLPKITKKLTKPNKYMVVAASTHNTDKEEEKIILNAWDKKYGTLVIAPRHPERFDEVDKIINDFIDTKDYSYHRYSKKEDFESDIVLVDCMGELVNIYAISDAVVLGGGFCTTEGGHNPIEPAYFGNTLISGDLIYHQYALFDNCKNYYLIKEEELKYYLGKIKTLKKSSIIGVGNVSKIVNDIKKEISKV